MKNLIGSTIQQYQILARVRETGTRILYKAYDPQTRQNVGLEVVKLHITDNAVLLDRLNEQAKKNASLAHSNIALVIDTGIHDDFIYLVYNFSPAHPLRRFFHRTYSWHEMARELVSATQTLAYAHEKGVYHGSLTPTSIMLNEKKIPFLFDFGFEQIITEHILANAPGSWINKWGVEYRSPEQLLGNQPDGRSDIYSIGVILYEWLSGEIAFHDPTVLNTIQRRIVSSSDELEPEKEIPPAIQTMIGKCLAAKPEDRYQSMQEVALILARGALDLTITRNMVKKPLAAPPLRINASRVLVTLSLVLVLVIGAGILLTQSSTSLFGFRGGGSQTETLLTSTPAKPKIATPSRVISTPTLVPAFTPTNNVFPVPPQGGFSSSMFPLFQGTPISPTGPIIRVDDIEQIQKVSPIGLWGIGDLTHLAVSPDGKQIVASSSIGLFVFNTDDLSFQRYVDTLSWVTAIDFSPDGKTIAVGDRDGTIQLRNTDTWQETGILSGRHTGGILDLDFSPNGTKLASIALDETLVQWDISLGGQSWTQVQATSVSCVSYSSDGKKVITGDNFFKVNIFASEDLKPTRTFTFPFKITDVGIIKETSLIVVGDASRALWLLDIESSDGQKPLGDMQFPLSQVAVSPDGSLIAGGDINGGIVVWDRKGVELWRAQGIVYEEEKSPVGTGKLHSLSFSMDGGLVFSGIRSGVLRSLDANTGSLAGENQSLNAHTDKLEVSHNGKYALMQYRDNTLKVWDIWNSKPLYSLKGRMVEGNSFSPTDRYIAVASDSSTVRVYATSDGSEIHTFNKNGDVKTIQFIQDGNYLVAGNKNETHLWSLISGQELKTERNFAPAGCPVIQDLDRNNIFYITDYHYVVIDPKNLNGLCRFQKLGLMKAIHISEPNHRVAYGGNSLLIVVDISGTSEQKWDLQRGVNLHNVVDVSMSPDGNLLATAYDDYTIHLWDVSDQKEITNPSGLYGHRNTITDLQFTPDGRILISTSLDGTIRLWGIPYEIKR